MRDAVGGTTVMAIIIIFIIIASGYMAFNVNYTKAFRMKDKLVTMYEKYNGNCNNDCRHEIGEYAKDVGYVHNNNLHCPDGYTLTDSLYCLKETKSQVGASGGGHIDNSGIVLDKKNICYYSFVTKINISIPVIDNIFDLEVFNITGDTKAMTGCK